MLIRTPRGFSLVEILTVIAILCILAAILFPVFEQARERDAATTCISNMKTIGLALAEYTVDYDGSLIKEYYGFPPLVNGVTNWGPSPPPSDIQYYSWRWAIRPYLRNITVFACPSNPVASDPSLWVNSVYYGSGSLGEWVPGGYCVNQDVIGFANGTSAGLSSGLSLASDISDPANTIAVADMRWIWNDTKINWIAGAMVTGASLPQGSSYQGGFTPCGSTSGPPPPPALADTCAYDLQGAFQPHQGFVNFLFFDSHVDKLKLATTAIPNDLWDSGLPLDSRTSIVQGMHTEYQ